MLCALIRSLFTHEDLESDSSSIREVRFAAAARVGLDDGADAGRAEWR
jgi:hypothetical protein